jgi:hypothetical protein
MVLDWHHANGKNQSKTARHFKKNGFPYMSQPRVSGKSLVIFVQQAESRGMALTGDVIPVGEISKFGSPF